MSKFSNNRKSKRLTHIEKTAPPILAPALAKRCKFNFYYAIREGNAGMLTCPNWTELLKKLQAFCEHPLSHWQQQPHGRSNILVNYGEYPEHSRISKPSTVPDGVIWSRFHLTGKCVLAGFVIPPDYHNESPDDRDLNFDKNTFYVVFLDQNHDFYPSSPK